MIFSNIEKNRILLERIYLKDPRLTDFGGGKLIYSNICRKSSAQNLIFIRL